MLEKIRHSGMLLAGIQIFYRIIPNQKMSKLNTQTLTKALKQKNRDKLVQAIDDIETWEPTDEPVVETIRKIREAQTDLVQRCINI